MNPPALVYSLYGLHFSCSQELSAPVLRSLAAPSLQVTTGPDSLPGDWAAPEVVYQSEFRDEVGHPAVSLYRAPAGLRLHFPRAGDFYLADQRIHCRPLPQGDPRLAEIYLLGTVLAWWREAQGVPVLHAAAVGIDDGAAAFLASNRGGKTSLAASLVREGAELLTDDLLAVEATASGWIGHSGYPQFRMWPDQARHFTRDPNDLALVHPSLEKRLVPLGQRGGTFHSGPLPLRAFYLPERRPEGEHDPEIRIAAAPPSARLMELVRHSFLARMVEAAGLQPARLPRLATLAAQLPVRTLSYPSGVEHLPAVTAAIRADLRNLGPEKSTVLRR